MAGDSRAKRWLVPGCQWGRDAPPPIDFQMHTTWTDGTCSVAEMIGAAVARGLKAITLTEHVNSQSGWYPNFVSEVKSLREAAPGPEVYYGVEVAAADLDGSLKADLSRHEAELVLGVVHRYPRGGGRFWDFAELTAEQGLELEVRALLGLARNPRVDVLGHPGGTTYRKYGPFPVARLEPVFRAARDSGVAVELNTRYVWDLEAFLALLRRVDPISSFGSDAHRAEDVGSNYQALLAHRGAAAEEARA